MEKEQRHVYFTGSVQGVGFRFTACRIAGRYEIDGYVRNLPDGRVECVVEGKISQIDAFLEDLTQSMSRYIRSQSQHEAQTGEKLGHFTIRY